MLKAHKIKHLEIEGSSTPRSKTLQAYLGGDDARALLNIMDESAGGANPTVANHLPLNQTPKPKAAPVKPSESRSKSPTETIASTHSPPAPMTPGQ